MRPLPWQTRFLALVQLLLVLPGMVSGSVCIPTGRTGEPEVGFCGCTATFGARLEASIALVTAGGCGPCRDEVFRSLRSTRPAFPLAPAPTSLSALTCMAALPPPIAGACLVRLGEPPGRRLPVLRC